jgi:hypothetical protein
MKSAVITSSICLLLFSSSIVNAAPEERYRESGSPIQLAQGNFEQNHTEDLLPPSVTGSGAHVAPTVTPPGAYDHSGYRHGHHQGGMSSNLNGGNPYGQQSNAGPGWQNNGGGGNSMGGGNGSGYGQYRNGQGNSGGGMHHSHHHHNRGNQFGSGNFRYDPTGPVSPEIKTWNSAKDTQPIVREGQRDLNSRGVRNYTIDGTASGETVPLIAAPKSLGGTK